MNEINEKKVREALAILDGVRTVEYNLDPMSQISKLLNEALTPGPRFYDGQQVLVSDDGTEWVKDILLQVGHSTVHIYQCESAGWRYCKPDPGAVSIPVWVEHDGTEKSIEGDVLLWVNKDGNCYTVKNSLIIGSGVIRYAIIPLPEYLRD